MKHRLFQVIATGEWAAAVLSDESFPDDDYVDRIAESFGLAAGEVRAVDIEDGKDDPRTGDLLREVKREAPAAVAAAPAMKTVLREA